MTYFLLSYIVIYVSKYYLFIVGRGLCSIVFTVTNSKLICKHIYHVHIMGIRIGLVNCHSSSNTSLNTTYVLIYWYDLVPTTYVPIHSKYVPNIYLAFYTRNTMEKSMTCSKKVIPRKRRPIIDNSLAGFCFEFLQRRRYSDTETKHPL